MIDLIKNMLRGEPDDHGHGESTSVQERLTFLELFKFSYELL